MWLQAEDGSMVNLSAVSIVAMRDGKGAVGTNGGTASEIVGGIGGIGVWVLAKGTKPAMGLLLDELRDLIRREAGGLVRIAELRPAEPPAAPPLDDPDGGRRGD